MITLLQEGRHRLIETVHDTKILYLDDVAYAWVEPRSSGEILVISHHAHKTDYTLSVGGYRMYAVQGEPYLSDLIHLELAIGDGEWQGYLLPTGLPDDSKKRSRIIPTNELIAGHAYSRASEHPSIVGDIRSIMKTEE